MQCLKNRKRSVQREKGNEKGRRKKRREYFNKEGASNYVERKRKFQVKRIMWI